MCRLSGRSWRRKRKGNDLLVKRKQSLLVPTSDWKAIFCGLWARKEAFSQSATPLLVDGPTDRNFSPNRVNAPRYSPQKILPRADKPDSVTAGSRRAAPVIYLGPSSRSGLNLPTPRDAPRGATGQATRPVPRSRCTWHFNPQGLSPQRIATPQRALLPHVFTLTWLHPQASPLAVWFL